MRFWIDVTDSDGVRYGQGPITTATRWTNTARMDRAGTFSFEMPAGDPKTAMVQAKREAHCYTLVDGAVTEVGAGIIDRIEVLDQPGGRGPMLRVSGDDLLRELAYRTVLRLELYDASTNLYDLEHPDEAWYLDTYAPTATSERMSAAIDGNYATYYTVNMDQYVYIYIGHHTPFCWSRFTFGTVNETSATLSGQYFGEGNGWTTLSGFSDGTSSGGKTFAQLGNITWTRPPDWVPTVHAGLERYWVRLRTTTTLAAVEIGEITIQPEHGSRTPVADIMAYAPSGWSVVDVDGDAGEAGERLGNRGFEELGSGSDTFADWSDTASDGSIDVETSSVHSGSRAVKLTGGPTQDTRVTQTIGSNLSGKRVWLSFWTRGDGTLAGRYHVWANGAGSWILSPSSEGSNTSTSYVRVEREFVCPVGTTSIIVGLRCPAGDGNYAMFDDVQVCVAPVHHRFDGESVLSALVRVAETTGEHFRLDTPDQLTWIGTDLRDSGVRLVGSGDGLALEGNSYVARIVEIAETSDTYEQISRIYPYGAGFGKARISLANTGMLAPTGYTLNTSSNYLEYDAGSPRIDHHTIWPDIGVDENELTGAEHSADTLFIAALNYLERHIGANKTYRVRVAGLQRAVYPGETVRVVYQRWVDGYRAVDIDDDLYVLEATHEIDGNGVRTVAMQLATVDTWPDSDGNIVVDLARRVQQLEARRAFTAKRVSAM